MDVYRYDAQGFYVEPATLGKNEPIPQNCTPVKPIDGLFKGKFVNGSWVEGMEPSELLNIQNTPQPVSELDELKKNQELMQKALDDLLLGGGL
jgi:hypothetical protein